MLSSSVKDQKRRKTGRQSFPAKTMEVLYQHLEAVLNPYQPRFFYFFQSAFFLSEFRRELHNTLDDPLKKKSLKGPDGSY